MRLRDKMFAYLVFTVFVPFILAFTMQLGHPIWIGINACLILGFVGAALWGLYKFAEEIANQIGGY